MKNLLSLLLLTSFLNGLAWIVLTPLWQCPDEQAHFAQVQTVAEFGTISFLDPNTSLEIDFTENVFGTQRDGSGNNKHTYHPEFRIDYSDDYYGPQELEISALPADSKRELVKNEATLNPPLYYLLAAGVYKIFSFGDIFTRVFAIRIMTLLFFVAGVYISYLIGQLVFNNNKLLTILLPVIVSFKPMLVFASSGVVPDALTNLLFWLIIYFSLKIIKIEKADRRTLLLAFVTLVLGVLTRQQFLIASLFIAVGLLYLVIIKPRDYLKKNISAIVSFASIIFLINQFGTRLPIVGFFRLPEGLFFTFKSLPRQDFIGYTVWTFRHTLSEVLPWYWGVYKWLSLTLPPIIYQVINRIVLLALLGLVMRMFVVLKQKKLEKEDFCILMMILFSIIYFGIFLVWDYSFYKIYGFSFGIQGRYFFPMVVGHLSILIFGLWFLFKTIIKNYVRYLILFLVLIMIFFHNFSLFYVSSFYYDTSNFNRFIIQASQYKPEIFKGSILIFILSATIFFQAIFFFNLTKAVLKTNYSEK